MPPSKRLRLSSSSQAVTVKKETKDTTDSLVTQSFHTFGDRFEDTGGEEEEDEEEEDEVEEEEAPKTVTKRRKRDKYLRYSRDDLERAAELVFQRKLSIFKAARLLNIPKTTLHYYVRNHQQQKSSQPFQPLPPPTPPKKRGQESQLSEAEEAELIEWLRVAANLGAPHMREDLLLAAADVLRLNKRPGFKNELPSNAWVTRFAARHPKAVHVRRTGVAIDETRFFTRFHAFLARNNWLDALSRPNAFYVMEDAYFELNACVDNSRNRGLLRKALARQGGDPNDFRRRDSVTMTYCFGADGRKLQELMIFNQEFKDIVKVARVDQELKSKFLFTRTKTGGQTRESLKCYFQRLDQELKDVKRPIFFFCSETLPHMGLDLFRWCHGREIFIVNYMPGGASVLEQCSEEIFGIDNSGWREEAERVKSANGRFTEVEFVRLVKSINDRVMSGEKIREIFETIGLFPFDTSKVDENCEEGGDVEMQEEVAVEETKVEHETILQKLETMKELTRSLKEDFTVKGLEHLLMNAGRIERQLETIENSL